MQGGAPEDLRRLKQAVEKVKCVSPKNKHKDDDESRNVIPPLDLLPVEEEILISPAVDARLEQARELFVFCVAFPVAMLHFDANAAACCSRKHQRVRDGAEIVIRLQHNLRTHLADKYFLFWSFFADEEFYLLALPILFWNVDYRFARQSTFMLLVGLVWGNILKDVFQLPRPVKVDSRVWVPHDATKLDSTACRDFGFPSTHALNSVSNALFTVAYCYHHSVGQLWFMIPAACFWIFSISFGRLYLGVHSPMDVKAGLSMGLAMTVITYAFADSLDNWLLHTPHVGVLMVSVITVLLTLHPQRRPMTPTFMQNCTGLGMILGAAIGFRMESDRRAGKGLLGFGNSGLSDVGENDAANNYSLMFLRTVVGYVLIFIIRMCLKQMFLATFRLVGLDPNPNKPIPRAEASTTAKRQVISGWDLCAAAIMKTGIYMALSWTILCGAPMFFDVVLGLPCLMNG